MRYDARTVVREHGLLLATLLLAAIYLAPSLSSGYIAEDLYQSLSPRIARVMHGHGLPGIIAGHFAHTIREGRFFPVTAVLIPLIHDVVGSPWQYKLFMLAGSLLDLALLHALVLKLTRRRELAAFTACATLGTIQYRACIDPSFALYGQMQLLIAAALGSMIALLCHLQATRGERLWYSVAVVLFVACCWTYEISYFFPLMYAILIVRARPSWPDRIRAFLPFVAVVALSASVSLLVRKMFPSTAYWHHTDFTPSEMAKAWVLQTTSGLPLSYFAADPSRLFPTSGNGSWLRWFLNARVLLVGIPGFLIAFHCLRQASKMGDSTSTTQPAEIDWWPVFGIGTVLATTPAILLSISPYHRGAMRPGVGWIPVLVQVYGVGMLVASGIWLTVSRRARGFAATRRALVASGIVSLLIANTYRANCEVARCFIATPGSSRFRGELARVGSGFQEQRANLEAALAAGLLNHLPAHATLSVAHTYPHWHDQTYGAWFYIACAGKPLDVTAPDRLATLRDTGRPFFRIRDVVDSPTGGYVLLSTESARDPGRPVRLFVRHQGITDSARRFDVRVMDETGRTPPMDLADAQVLATGPDWVLYDLDSLARHADSDSLQVRYAPRSSGSIAAGTGELKRR